MLLLLLGGVQTNSSLILSEINAGNSSLWESSTFWIAIAAAAIAFAATNKISAGGFSLQGSSESVMAGFATAIFVVFATDLMSIVSLVGSKTCAIEAGCTILQHSWEYWVVTGIGFPSLVGFGVSILNFIRGND